RGPLGAGEIESASKSRPGWWEWGEAKMALEWLFWAGRITTASRRNFERLYDLPERVFPPETLALPTPTREESIRHLLRLSAVAMGIGTAAELRDYLRLPVEGLKTHIAELVEEGTLEPVSLEGSRLPHYKHRDAHLPRWVRGAALLSPFDSLVWERDRTERLFGFFYRLEIYTPAPKRRHGYYVLPFRLDEDIPARLCLKAERATGTLVVNSAHLEEGRDAETVAAAAAPELRRMAEWLGLESVRVGRRGDLSTPLRKALL
ncbi:MAG TPA: crosslink repair DNA glycosylase YcaQ family protein, partial [Kiloniellales bacterium]|nr:crosslink repair DNA glycosylase YcaQ family protein [Kiloniellales bacterium]